MDEYPRFSVNMNADTAETIEGLMAAKGVTATELLRLMTSAYRALQEIQDDPAAKLLVERGGNLTEILFG